MTMTRRGALAGLGGGAALLAAPTLSRARTAERVFTVLRGGSEMGTHAIALSRSGGRVEVAIDIDLAVRIVGIPVYRYTMRNNEVWSDGLLVAIDSRVNDDGEEKRVTARRAGEAVAIDGSSYEGTAPADAATTTYFTTDFLRRARWISTDGGTVLRVRHEKLGAGTVETAAGTVETTRWRVSDGDAYEVEIAYDADGEWVGLGFDAGGEPASYRMERRGGSFAAIWAG